MSRGRQAAVPPGQYFVPDFTIYKVLGQPQVGEDEWRLVVRRNGVQKLVLTLDELKELGVVKVRRDFHCVTGWSVADVEWEGVPIHRVAEAAGIGGEFEWLFIEGYDGYTTVVHREDALKPDSLIAFKVNGRPLEPEQGWPARVVFAHLYGWKGAKWVHILDFLDHYRDGYWEALGYHERGRVWEEERFKKTSRSHSY